MFADPYSYSRWVVGTKAILSADPSWPADGSVFRYSAGLGPLSFQGETVVRECESCNQLELEADAHMFAARISLTVKAWGDGSLAGIEEHLIRGPAVLLDNPFVDLVLEFRNGWLVRNLRSVVESRYGSRVSGLTASGR